jgi:hypothetical protein
VKPRDQPEQIMVAVPICFASSQDFERWSKSYNPQRCSHCRDCTPTFQLRMKKQRRCERPEMMFALEDGGVVGCA